MPLRLEGIPVVPTQKSASADSLSGAESPGPSGSPGRFRAILQALGSRLDAGEALMGGTLRGDLGSLDAPQLIAIQAGVYRYTEVLDLSGKLLDRATSAVRTVLQPGGH